MEKICICYFHDLSMLFLSLGHSAAEALTFCHLDFVKRSLKPSKFAAAATANWLVGYCGLHSVQVRNGVQVMYRVPQ